MEFLVFIMIVTILLINLLIAMMGNTYGWVGTTKTHLNVASSQSVDVNMCLPKRLDQNMSRKKIRKSVNHREIAAIKNEWMRQWAQTVLVKLPSVIKSQFCATNQDILFSLFVASQLVERGISPSARLRSPQATGIFLPLYRWLGPGLRMDIASTWPMAQRHFFSRRSSVKRKRWWLNTLWITWWRLQWMWRLNVIFEGGDDELDQFETEEHDERREEEEDFWRTAAAATWEGLGAVLTLRIPTHHVPPDVWAH